MNRADDDRPFQFTLLKLLLVTAAIGFVVAKPATALICGVSLAMLILGLALVRSASMHRGTGWLSGLVFGIVFTAFGAAASVYALYLLAVSWVTGGI